LRTSPDGAYLYFLLKDDNGIVQVYKVPATGGDIRQVTRLAESVQTQFNLNADGTMLAFGAGNAVWVTDVGSGAATMLTQKYTNDEAPITTVLWNPQGDILVYNRYVGTGSERYLQIFKATLPLTPPS
jgi:tricorn protease-like protein